MHYEKFKGSVAVQKVLEHSDRGIDSSDTHKHSNESIDKSRTHLNYELKDRGGLTAYEYHRQRIEQITAETKERTGKGIRKDAVTLCSWVVTAPQDLPTEKHSDFFKGVYGWFAERYGEDNIVTAVVHKDEKTPHMHFQFTPIIENDGVRRLCAKEVENRKSLQTIHKKLQKHLTSELGCEINLLNGATENGNKTIQQMKNEELQVENEQLRAENKQLRAENEQFRAEQESARRNLLDSIPPFVPEEYPPKPAIPSGYDLEKRPDVNLNSSGVVRKLQESKQKDWDKQRETSIKKRDKKYEEVCAEVDKRNEERRREWEEKYLTADNLRKASRQLEEDRQQIEPTLQQARTEKARALQERKSLEAERKKQSESYENDVQQGIQAGIDKCFGERPKGRAERLEAFSDRIDFPDGETALDKFEREEEELRQQLKSKFKGR